MFKLEHCCLGGIMVTSLSDIWVYCTWISHSLYPLYIILTAIFRVNLVCQLTTLFYFQPPVIKDHSNSCLYDCVYISIDDILCEYIWKQLNEPILSWVSEFYVAACSSYIIQHVPCVCSDDILCKYIWEQSILSWVSEWVASFM